MHSSICVKFKRSIYFVQCVQTFDWYCLYVLYTVFTQFKIILFFRSFDNKTLPMIPDPIMELMKLNEAEDIELVPLSPMSLCEDNKQSLSPSICKRQKLTSQACSIQLNISITQLNTQTHLLSFTVFFFTSVVSPTPLLRCPAALDGCFPCHGLKQQ